MLTGSRIDECEAAKLEAAQRKGFTNPWKPMQSAPKDGTLVDLMYPHPRGRTVDCSWNATLGWHWKRPRWAPGEVEPEMCSSTYPNMNPLAWMPCPPRPEI